MEGMGRVALGGGSRTDLATAVIALVIARLVGDSPVGKKVGEKVI